MNVKRSRRVAFDARSLALFASLALGGGLAAQFTTGPGPAGPAGSLARNVNKVDANRDGVPSRPEFDRSRK